MNNTELIKKYDIPVPRYTSYPTVPYWDNKITTDQWFKLAKESFEKTNLQEGISLYIHLPYCENLCTFCGCNKKISKTHDVENAYIDTVLKEWEIYTNLFQTKPIIKEIHLGGGTPTFFSANNLSRLIQTIKDNSVIHKDYEFSIEVHPNFTKKEQLDVLFNHGFRRLSIGIQDFDPEIQKAINRIQDYETVEKLYNHARKIGFTSINFDLVYGLPFQKESSINLTMNLVKQLKPDRIALYSYAHVPWKSKTQRRYTEEDLPKGDYKRNLYELAKGLLQEQHYYEIGMDHFSLETDSLFKAYSSKKMHRNFMGYTHNYTELLIGLGCSSISDSWSSFIQNEKDVDLYIEQINKGVLPIIAGQILTETDKIIRRIILDLMCHFEVEISSELNISLKDIFERLEAFKKDGLVSFTDKKVFVTEEGKKFIRNICSAFDLRLHDKNTEMKLFSKAI